MIEHDVFASTTVEPVRLAEREGHFVLTSLDATVRDILQDFVGRPLALTIKALDVPGGQPQDEP